MTHTGRAGPHSEPARERPRELPLRLVPPELAELGPISPELVLVCPELADAARRALPDSPAVARGAASAPPAQAAGPGTHGPARTEPILWDTIDSRLATHRISLARSSYGWKLTLARGEVVEVEADEGAESPPEEIIGLLRAVVREERLLPVPWEREHRDFLHLQEQIWAQRRALLEHDPGTRFGVDAENLHQFRVASRRTRAFLRVARRFVDRPWAASLNAELRELGRSVAPVRDLDVLLERIREDVAALEEQDRQAGRALLDALESERELRQADLVRALEDGSYLDLVERLAQPIPAASEPPRASLEQLAARELRRLGAEVRRLGDSPEDEALHGLRISVKRARYAVELAGRGAKGPAERVIQAAKALQDVLGEHQDAAVAEERLRATAEQDENASLAFVAGRLAERTKLRRDELRLRLPIAWRRLRRAARKLR